MSRRGVILATIAAAAAAWPAWAHHSHGNYKMQEFTTLKGTVKEMHWLTPHSWIYLDVKDAGSEAVLWALEGASVGELRRRGWMADSIKVGDTRLACAATCCRTARPGACWATSPWPAARKSCSISGRTGLPGGRAGGRLSPTRRPRRSSLQE